MYHTLIKNVFHKIFCTMLNCWVLSQNKKEKRLYPRLSEWFIEWVKDKQLHKGDSILKQNVGEIYDIIRLERHHYFKGENIYIHDWSSRVLYSPWSRPGFARIDGISVYFTRVWFCTFLGRCHQRKILVKIKKKKKERKVRKHLRRRVQIKGLDSLIYQVTVTKKVL